MKKIIVLVSAIMLLTVTPLLAVIGPIPIDESNVLPDGQSYGTVTVTLLPNYCTGSGGPYDGVEVKVDANQSILTPLSNFGIQVFGFNYNGNLDELTVTGPTGWFIDTYRNISEFGVFMADPTGTGTMRKDPLTVQVCNCCNDLMEGDVIAKNVDGYTFAVHIAGFSYPGFTETSSAFFATMKTTLIELSSFTAVPGNSVTLNWVTETETETAGFNILRADKKKGVYEQINESLIPSEGSTTQGASYEFVNNDVQKGKKYFYKLEDIDSNGTSTLHGPVKVKVKKK